MLLQSFLGIGTLAVTANAVLVPYKIEDSKVPDLSIYQGAKKITLDCSTCPYALKTEEDGKRGWSHEIPSDLEMEFDVKDNFITFNGVPISPLNNPTLPPILSVAQKAKEGAESDVNGDVEDLRLSYSLEMIQKPFDDGNTLLTLTMSVMALDNQMIRVDDIELKAIKDSNGNVILHTIDSVPASPDSPDAKCVNVLCRIFTKFLASVARAKSTAKTTAHKVKAHCMKCFRCVLRMLRHKGHQHHANHGSGSPHRLPEGTNVLPTHHQWRPQAPNGQPQFVHPGHMHAHKGGFFARMGHIFWITFKVAFVPILIGVAFGMAASAIGMLVGQIVVFLWMRYRRNDACPVYMALPVDIKEEVPPPYEDLPAPEAEALSEKEMEAKA